MEGRRVRADGPDALEEPAIESLTPGANGAAPENSGQRDSNRPAGLADGLEVGVLYGNTVSRYAPGATSRRLGPPRRRIAAP
jgi:hypothetical protein